MFQVGDRVQNRYLYGDSFIGTVIVVKGRWVSVKHDDKKWPPSVGDRFEYMDDELKHVNPLLRFARAL